MYQGKIQLIIETLTKVSIFQIDIPKQHKLKTKPTSVVSKMIKKVKLLFFELYSKYPIEKGKFHLQFENSQKNEKIKVINFLQ